MQFPDYLLNPYDQLTVLVVGVGGTGSKVAIHLARISHTLKKLKCLPLNIILIDDDIVEPHNIGRQNYYPEDVNQYKSTVLSNRIFNSYDVPVSSIEGKLTDDLLTDLAPNFIISCVDNMEARYLIDNHNFIEENENKKLYAWIDTGNESNFGQIFITDFVQNKGFRETFGEIDNDMQTPSCSVEQSLAKQDLFINDFSALSAANSLWSILTDLKIDYNIKSFNSSSLTIL